MEKKSVAGNNLLSLVEHDALVSHAAAYSLCTWAEVQETAQVWAWAQPGVPLPADRVDAAIEAMESYDLIPAKKAEARRITEAVRTLFGRDVQ